jgi:aminopeptidase N
MCSRQSAPSPSTRTLGDAAFWTAVRAYTKAHAGRAVTSSELQRAFEASSGRTLTAFFDEWVRPR